MLNAEHYNDPTASIALGKVMPKSKKKWDTEPAYVAEVARRNEDFSSRVSEMSLEQIKAKLRNCAKCNGDAFVCVGCVEDKGGCIFGKRAVELLDDMTKAPNESERRREIGRTKGTQALIQKTIMEYKAALDSGDPIKYILEHSNSNADETQKRYMARAKLHRWEKAYGGLINADKVPTQEPIPVKDLVEKTEEPHLMQMPCLSKKVAAEREAQQENETIKQTFKRKMDALKEAMDDVQKQIDELLNLKKKYTTQLDAMVTTAECLEIAL